MTFSDSLTEASPLCGPIATGGVPRRAPRDRSPHVAPWHLRRVRRCVGLEVESRAAVSARHSVRLACALWTVPHLYDTAAACVTELVSNAVKHARWPSDPDARVLWLVMSLAGPYLLVEVCDPDRALPVIAGPVDWDSVNWRAGADGGTGESGMGLFTVTERIRESGGQFGVAISDHGKTVFFALPTGGFPGPDSGRDGAGSVLLITGA